jgi:hypothetical protein
MAPSKKVVVVHVRVPKTQWFVGYALVQYLDGIQSKSSPAEKKLFESPTEAVAYAQNKGWSVCNHTQWSEAVRV